MMSMVTVNFKVFVRLVSTTAALARSMFFTSFLVRRRIAASVHVSWFSIFVNLTMHWGLNRATLCMMSAVLHRMHRMLFYHVMDMVAVVVGVVTVMFTMHFVMFSHNLPLMLV
jgi:hypothetical protein